MRIVCLSPDLHEAYDAFVDQDDAATVYHTRDWLSFLASIFPLAPRSLVAVDDDHRILGVLPLAERRRLRGRSLEALPFSHRVEPLGEPEIVEALVNDIRRRAVAAKLPLVLRGVDVSGEAGSRASFVNTVVPLPDSVASLNGSMRDATRQQLRQAERMRRLSLHRAESPEDFAAMDAIMADNRRFLASATYPAGFFATLASVLGEKIHAEICRDDGAAIAFFVSSLHGRRAIYHYGASRTDPELRRLRPNNLLYWSALKRAVEAGAESFDLGTSLPTQEGLIRFKEGWGGVTTPLPMTTFDAEGNFSVAGFSQESPLARLVGRAVARLPMSLYRLVTPPLLREFG